MKLMIVDDHASTREMIRKFLNFPGITFCECASGHEAMEAVHEFQPDWVTMDVHMPGLNGFECTEAMRAKYPAARVMIVTADNQPHFRQLSHSVGATGLLAKENLLALRMMIAKEMASHTPPAPSPPGSETSN